MSDYIQIGRFSIAKAHALELTEDEFHSAHGKALGGQAEATWKGIEEFQKANKPKPKRKPKRTTSKNEKEGGGK